MRASVLLLAFAGFGCASIQTRPRALTIPAASSCDLKLYIENVQGQETRLSAVELHGDEVSEGVCIKPHDGALALPERIVIAGQPLDAFGYVCEADPAPLKGDTRQWCVWNHVVRNAYPLTFTLVAEQGVVSDHVALARVYRNGSLLSRYNASSALKNPRVLEFSGKALAISNSPFSARPPHLARMALRIVPAGIEFDATVLDEEIVSYRARTRQRLSDLGDAVIGTLDPTLGKKVSCALERLRSIETQVRSFVTPTPKAQVTSCEDGDVPAAPAFVAFRKRFDELADATEKKLDRVASEVDHDLDGGRAWLESALTKVRSDSKLPDAIKGYADELARLEGQLASTAEAQRAELHRKIDWVKGELDRARAALTKLDGIIDDTARLMGETESLARDLRNTVRKTLADKKAGVRAYDAMVASLEKSGSLFEVYRDNPALIVGERQLELRHGDKLQTYALAPWNGAVFRVAGIKEPTFGADNLIPILDLFGVRYQWDESRFSEFRAAVGALYFRDKRTVAGVVEEDFTPAFQANVSIGNVKLGAGFAFWNPQHGDGVGGEKVLRLLLGADLLKLISGTNVEAL